MGCVRCGGLHVWTQSLTRAVSRTVCGLTGDLAGAPLLLLWTLTPPLAGRRTLRWVPCVCAFACSSWQGRAGRPSGRVLVRLTFPVAALSVYFARPTPPWGYLFLLVCMPSFWFFFFVPPRPRSLSLSLVSGPGFPRHWRWLPPFSPAPFFFSGLLWLVFVSCRPPFPLPSPSLFSPLLSGPGFRCCLFGLLFVSSVPPLPLPPPLFFLACFAFWPPPPRGACRPRGECWAPTPTRPRPQHVGGGPQQPAQWAGSRGGGAPDHRRPSQRWKAPPPGDALPPPPQRATPARKGTRCGAGAGSHARTDGTRNTRVAEPWLPAPEDGRPGEEQRLTADAPHNDGRPSPPGTASHHPCGTQPPQGMQAKRTVLGPHIHTPTPTARGWRTPTARPVGGQSGKGRRLTTDAPHNGGRHPPPGDALPAPPRRAEPARKGARCGASAGSPRPQRPHPAHTGRGTLAACPRGRTAGRRTAPDTRRPSQRWQATPPGDGPPPPPRHTTHAGHAGQGDSVGPPHPHARAHSTWVAHFNSPPSGRAVGEGEAPDHRRPSQRWKAPPPRGCPSGTPTARRAGPQGRALWGQCWVPTPATTAPGTHGSRNPGCLPQRTDGREKDST